MRMPPSRRLTVGAATLLTVLGAFGLYRSWPESPTSLVASPRELRVAMGFGATQTVDIQLENTGRSTAAILGVSSSCGCTVGTPKEKQLSSGKSTLLKVEIHAKSIGQKNSVVDVTYQSLNERKTLRIPIAMNVTEGPGTRVLSYPRDLSARSDPKRELRSEFEIRTLEQADVESDLLAVTSADDRCQFRVLDVTSSEPDRNGKCERKYQIEMIVSPSGTFAAIARMRFREALAAPAGNIAVVVKPSARTQLVPATIELPATFTESSPQKHEALLVSESEIEDWRLAENISIPNWLSVKFEILRPNITRVIIADSRRPRTTVDNGANLELKLDSSTETVLMPVRIRQ